MKKHSDLYSDFRFVSAIRDGHYFCEPMTYLRINETFREQKL